MYWIDGHTRLAGVVGTPLGHSLSPAMHNAAYEALGLNWAYIPIELHDEDGLRRFVSAVRAMDFVGFNITMPFKRVMLDLCDEATELAMVSAAVNTVLCRDGRLIGHNTDGRGLLEALEVEAGYVPADKEVVVLGSGGAASAAVAALAHAQAARVTVAARDASSAESLVAHVRPHAEHVRLEASSLEGAESAVREAALVVNATPAGMRAGDRSPVPQSWWSEGQVVYDMVYGTAEPTAMVAEAASAGATALAGLGMLVSQGATAIDIWSQAEGRAPRDVMRRAAEQALRTRAKAD